MRIRYVRFLHGVGTPGHAGNNITTAFLRSKAVETQPKDRVMDDMFVEGVFLVLRRKMLVDGERIIAERLVPLQHCIDLEPAPERPKKDKSNEPPDQS